ncbi:hypothetical protein BDW22DRAFT_1360006 [Trametopsis cervina]|nr:hypothetical protein BDW22DRAFT_1360006 [Trametopsis cervina]
MLFFPHLKSLADKVSPTTQEVNRGAILRRGGLRAHRKNARPSSAGAGPTQARPVRPDFEDQRSISYSNVDRFDTRLEWSVVETDGHLRRSPSYCSVSADGPIMDIRHDCVKSSSPTIVYQDRPYDTTPLTAEVFHLDSAADEKQSAAAGQNWSEAKECAPQKKVDASFRKPPPYLSICIPTVDIHP